VIYWLLKATEFICTISSVQDLFVISLDDFNNDLKKGLNIYLEPEMNIFVTKVHNIATRFK